MKSLWASVVLGVLLGLGVTLGSADFLAVYHGVAVGHRPLPGSDGLGDEVRLFVLDQGDAWTEVVLPVDAFSAWDLPLAPRGVPPAERPEDAPRVEKTRFSWSVRVDGEPVSLLSPADLFFGLLAGLGVVLGRNALVAGHPFRLERDPERRKGKPKRKVGQAAAGRPAKPPRPARPQKGPPPRRGKGKRRRR